MENNKGWGGGHQQAKYVGKSNRSQNKYKPLDLTKIRNNITTNAHQPLIVLVLSGALSPVHNMHLHCFALTRQALEAQNRTVVGAFVCPSSDGYVISKLGNEAIRIKNRNYLCQIATADSNWITVNTWGMANAYAIMEETEEILKKEIPERSFEVWLVAGADHACKHGLFTNASIKVACIGRPGETEGLRQAMRESKKQLSKHFVMVEEEAADVSSTRVRALILAGKWEEMRKIVPEGVVDHLQKVGNSIFKE